jgi:hypothetical protein
MVRRVEEDRLPRRFVADQVTVRPGEPAGVHGDDHGHMIVAR